MGIRNCRTQNLQSNEQGKEVVKGKTNEQGIAKFKLPYGKYTYKETIAPNGYVINEETFGFEIKEDGEIIKHIVKNKKKRHRFLLSQISQHRMEKRNLLLM